MKVTANSLKIIAEDLSKKITYNHMSNVTIINSRDIFITFSMHRKERLLISLNPGNPLVALIEINNKPFFYWSVQSICKFVKPDSLTFVVLEEHVSKFNVDSIIRNYYPWCKIVIIPEVLPGAVSTCLAGVEWIDDDGVLIYITKDLFNLGPHEREATNLAAADT